jgi:plasmid stabilization system protein ParE
MPAASYVLTPTARQQLREAKAWSLARWSEELTEQYFRDLEKTALHLAANHARYTKRKEMTGETGPCLYPAREHYFVYEPLTNRKIAIVALIRQGRDIPALLSRNAPLFRRELDKIRNKRRS